jgi:beta-lactamase class A
VLLFAKRGGGSDDPQPTAAQSTAPAATATVTAAPTPVPTQPATAGTYTPTLSLSTEYVVFSPGETWDIDMEVINPPAGEYSLIYNINDESVVSAVWGDWYEENATTLTLTCLAQGTTTVYIDVCSEDGNTVYSTSSVYVEAGAAGLLDTAYLNELIGGTNAGVEIIDVTRGGSYSSSGSEDSLAASALINIPILFTAALYVDYGETAMSDGILFNYTSGGRGGISAAYSGTYLSLDDLLSNMLLYSDNNASNSLLDYFGFENLNDICNESGFGSVYVSSYIGSGYDNYASASDIAWMLYYLWDDNLSLGRKYLAEHMFIADSYARVGLGAYLPSECAFLNHNGFKDGVYSEAAIVYSGDEIYIVTFVGNGGSYWDLASLAGDIGSYVQYCLG